MGQHARLQGLQRGAQEAGEREGVRRSGDFLDGYGDGISRGGFFRCLIHFHSSELVQSNGRGLCCTLPFTSISRFQPVIGSLFNVATLTSHHHPGQRLDLSPAPSIRRYSQRATNHSAQRPALCTSYPTFQCI
jgi:hypothetical protein